MRKSFPNFIKTNKLVTHFWRSLMEKSKRRLRLIRIWNVNYKNFIEYLKLEYSFAKNTTNIIGILKDDWNKIPTTLALKKHLQFYIQREIPSNRSICCKNFPRSLNIFFTLVGPHPKSFESRKRGHEISICWKEFLLTAQKTDFKGGVSGSSKIRRFLR